MTKEDKSDTELANESTESNENQPEKEEKTNGTENDPEEEGEADPLSAGDAEEEETAEDGNDADDDPDAEIEDEDAEMDDNDDDYGKKKKAPKKKKPVSKKASSGKKGKGKKSKAGRPKKQEEEEEYEVQDIMDHKEVKGKLLYKIRWKGYGPSGDTWEPVQTLSCPDILDKYNKKNKLDGGKRKSDSKTPRAPPKKQKIEYDDEDEDEDPEAEYEVERLIDVREKRNGSREFLVHWKGWSKKFETWEPEDNLNCQDLIEKFLEKLEKVKGSSQKSLRVVKKHTQRFTLTAADKGRRISKRNSGKQRAVYFDADD